jgi:hypothetical protein
MCGVEETKAIPPFKVPFSTGCNGNCRKQALAQACAVSSPNREPLCGTSFPKVCLTVATLFRQDGLQSQVFAITLVAIAFAAPEVPLRPRIGVFRQRLKRLRNNSGVPDKHRTPAAKAEFISSEWRYA